MILLIPCCGESERFNGLKKQFLMHPNGIPLPLFSASGITGYDKRFFIFLEKDFNESSHYCYYKMDEIILLNHQTKNQVQTIQLALQILINSDRINGNDSIYIKDCDNYFKSVVIKNCVSTIHPAMGMHNLVNLNKKSYSLVDNLKRLHCIKERGMYTNYMNVGGYGFENIFDFLIYSSNKKYISEVVQAAINDGGVFTINDVSQYIDYGTQSDWHAYLQTLNKKTPDKNKRKAFEESEWIINPIDLMPKNPLADPNCESCKGHGVVDAGYFTGCILENCPDCWVK